MLLALPPRPGSGLDPRPGPALTSHPHVFPSEAVSWESWEHFPAALSEGWGGAGPIGSAAPPALTLT